MQKINFQNLPSTTTPLNATNMNAIQTNVEDVFNGNVAAGNMVVGSITGKNLFNVNSTTLNSALASDGTITARNGYMISDYIEVEPNTDYYLTNVSGSNQVRTCGFFNSNLSFISYEGISGDVVVSGKITTPANTKYMLVSVSMSNTNIQVEKGATATTYAPYNAYGSSSFKNENLVVGGISSKNIFNADNPSAIANGMTWTGNGDAHYLSSSITFTGGIRWFFKVNAGESYTFSYKQRNSTNVYLYIRELQTPDWSGTNLRTIVNDGTNTSYSFTIQNNSYLGIAFQNGQSISNILFEDIQLERGDVKTPFYLYQGLGYTSGSNTNGNYTKFDDGTLIQWGTISVSANTASYEQTFPIQFINATISVLLTNIYSNSKKVIWTHTTTASKLTAYPMNYEGNSVPTFGTSASWLAIGRWK